WPDHMSEDFAADLCKLFVANGWSFNTANSLQTRKWLAKWVGKGVVVPDRRNISGELLDRAVEKAEGEIREEVQGKLVTGQNDGWKNISKAALLALMFTACRKAYLASTYNMSGQPKTGDNLFRIVLEEIKSFETKYGVEVVAWVTDDGPDGKKMRRLLAKHMKKLIVLLCWAHQIQL
ncbi:hypothetical protein K488DRAFT_6909, partial [Vararia minispora EC-137]